MMKYHYTWEENKPPHSIQITPKLWHLIHSKCQILQVRSVSEGYVEWESSSL